MKTFVLAALIALLSIAGMASAASPKQIWVSPSGSDSAKGTKVAPLRSLDAAWQRVPNRRANVVINLKTGSYTDSSPNYWENKSGRISVVGRGRVLLPAVNIYGVKGLEFRGIKFLGDIHCERCTRFSLNRVSANLRDAWEVIKINQSSGIKITGSSFSGAGDNVLDLVAVRHARIRGNTFRDAGDWCGYAKGGSVDILVSDNLFSDCGTGGFTAGQGTGFQFMTAPFLQYEATGVVIERNTVRDTEGAAVGVNGGYNILVRNNLALNVGQRSHVLEVGFGQRSCDGAPGSDPVRLRCGQYLRRGGWGTIRQDSQPNGIVNIPNRNVYFLGNVIYSPNNYYDGNQQILSIRGPLEHQAGSGVPRGSSGDRGLVFRKNIIFTNPRDLELGLGDACRPNNPTCNQSQLLRDNTINALRPNLVGQRRLTATGWAKRYTRVKAARPDWKNLPAGRVPFKKWPGRR